MAIGSIDAWTAYWRAGRSASCFEGSDTELQLTRLWDELIACLPAGGRLLDLATGNGTVACGCARSARRLNLKLDIEAVDAADIDPAKHVADPQNLFADISFHGGVHLEDLPYPDRSFDAVVSQFGFEYADEARATGEAARVLAHGGWLRMVMHARDGAIVQDISRRIERLESVLEERGPVTLVRTLARAAVAGDAHTMKTSAPYLVPAAALARELADRPPPDDAALFYASEFLSQWSRRDRYWPADLQRSLEDGWCNAAGVLARQRQMLAASRTADDISRLRERLAAAGLVAGRAAGVRDERRRRQIAWLVDARRPSAG